MKRALTLLLIVALGLSGTTAASAKAGKEKWRESGTVESVLDGDTFDMTVGDEVVRVRINGIQAPESDWCGGKEARDALRELLPKGTEVRLASLKEKSGNAPNGVWRLKRTVHVMRDGEWTDIAPSMLSRGLAFPFPFIGESAHNKTYLALAFEASKQGAGMYNPAMCGKSIADDEPLSLQVVSDGPGADTANSEFVMVFNGSDHDIDLSGWMVQDTSPLNAFFFPKGTTLRSDDYVVVFSGKGTRGEAPDGSKDDRFFYADLGQRWNNNVTDIAFLFDDVGPDRTGNLRAWLVLQPGA